MQWKLNARTILTWKFPNLQYLSVHLTFILTCLFTCLSVCLSVRHSFLPAYLTVCLLVLQMWRRWCRQILSALRYDTVWHCMMLYDAAWCCMMLYDAVWCCMMLYDAVWCCMMLYIGIYLLYAMCTHVKMPLHSLCCVSPTINILSEPGPRKTTLNTGSAVWCFEHCCPIKVLTGVLVLSSSTTAIVACSQVQMWLQAMIAVE